MTVLCVPYSLDAGGDETFGDAGLSALSHVRSKVDRCVPRNQNVNLRTVRQLSTFGDAGLSALSQVRVHSKVDRCVPRNRIVNLRIVPQRFQHPLASEEGATKKVLRAFT